MNLPAPAHGSPKCVKVIGRNDLSGCFKKFNSFVDEIGELLAFFLVCKSGIGNDCASTFVNPQNHDVQALCEVHKGCPVEGGLQMFASDLDAATLIGCKREFARHGIMRADNITHHLVVGDD